MKKIILILFSTILIFGFTNCASNDDVDKLSQVTGIIKGTFEFDNYPVEGVAVSIGAIVEGLKHPFELTYTNESGTTFFDHIFLETNPEDLGKTHYFKTYEDSYILGIQVVYFNMKEDSNFSYTITFEFDNKTYKKQITPEFTGDEHIILMYIFDTTKRSIEVKKSDEL